MNKTLFELYLCYINQFGFDVDIPGHVTGLSFLTIMKLEKIAKYNQQPDLKINSQSLGGGECTEKSGELVPGKTNYYPPADIINYETPGYPKLIKAKKIKSQMN